MEFGDGQRRVTVHPRQAPGGSPLLLEHYLPVLSAKLRAVAYAAVIARRAPEIARHRDAQPLWGRVSPRCRSLAAACHEAISAPAVPIAASAQPPQRLCLGYACPSLTPHLFRRSVRLPIVHLNLRPSQTRFQ